MTEGPQIPSDWPQDISVPVVSPLAYLRIQASKLSELTRGVVWGNVSTTTSETNPMVMHNLSVVVPAANAYREELLRAFHRSDRPYPARVESPEFEPDPDSNIDPDEFEWPRAETYEEFRQLVRKVLNSPNTISLIQSLIARATDAKLAAG